MSAIIGIVLFLMLLFMVIVGIPWQKKLTYKAYTILFGGFALSLAILAYSVEPPYSWDLFRHFDFMSLIQKSNCSLFEFIKSPQIIIQYRQYRFVLVFDLLCYLFGKIGNLHLLPFFMVLIDYLVIGYITIDWSKEHKKSTNLYGISLLVAFMFLPFIYANSGLRNATAACLVALAIYFRLYKKKSLLLCILIIGAGTLIHSSVIIVLPLLLLAEYHMRFSTIAVVLIVTFQLQILAGYFLNSSWRFLRSISQQYLWYSDTSQYRNSRRYLYADLICIGIFFVILLVVWFQQNRNKQNTQENKLISYLLLHMCFVLGNIGNYDLVLRPAYVLAAFSTPITYYLIYSNIWKNRYLQCVKLLLVFIVVMMAIWVISDSINIYFI